MGAADLRRWTPGDLLHSDSHAWMFNLWGAGRVFGWGRPAGDGHGSNRADQRDAVHVYGGGHELGRSRTPVGGVESGYSVRDAGTVGEPDGGGVPADRGRRFRC